MPQTELALLIYIAWTLLLLGAIACLRIGYTLTGKKRANSFRPDGYDVSPLSGRLCRAHANCYESFPFIGGLLLFTLSTDNTAISDGLALIVAISRIIQSSIHVLSTGVIAVQLRFVFFLVQYGIGAYWASQLPVLFL